jgi:hypothetical protein
VSAPRDQVIGIMLIAVLRVAAPADAHDGPPFPIVSDRIAGNYRISIWTDPDATDDGTAGGQFWETLEPAGGSAPIPADTRVTISIAPIDRAGPTQTSHGTPTRRDASRQFGAVVLDHEGRFRMRVDIDGPLGQAAVDAEVDATYDLRPPPIMLAIYVMPFLIVGLLWLKLLLRRRRGTVVRTG